jgi:AcrR family transcriptional regulator
MPRQHESSTCRKQQIIDAARKLIITHGSEHVTIKGLAREVGISEAAIYRHFDEKRDVLLFLADDIGAALMRDINGCPEIEPNALARLDVLLNKQISAIEQSRGVSFQVIAEIISMGDRGLNQHMAGIVDQYIDGLKCIFEDAIREGELPSNFDAEGAASLVFGFTQGVVNLWALNNYQFDLRHRYQSAWDSFRHNIDGYRRHRSLPPAPSNQKHKEVKHV